MIGTIYNNWNESKLDTYTEPIRKGTKKGDSIGLSSQKHKYALLMLCSEYQSTREASKVIERPVSLISKWKTEKHVQKEIDKLSNEFVEHVMGILTDKNNEYKTWAVMYEFPHYSASVREQVIEKLGSKIDEIERDNPPVEEPIEDLVRDLKKMKEETPQEKAAIRELEGKIAKITESRIQKIESGSIYFGVLRNVLATSHALSLSGNIKVIKAFVEREKNRFVNITVNLREVTPCVSSMECEVLKSAYEEAAIFLTSYLITHY